MNEQVNEIVDKFKPTASRLLVYLFACLPIICLLGYLFIRVQTTSPLQRDLDEIRREGVLRVVMEYGKAGYELDAARDTAQGFQYELLHRFADSLRVPIRFFVENSLEKCVQGLDAGRYDLIARNIPITTELRGKVAFSEPLMKNKLVLVQRTRRANSKRNPIRNQLDLAKQTLYVPEHSPYLLRLRNLAKEIGDSIYVKQIPHYEAEQLIILVAKGDIDFAVADEWTARQAQRNYSEIDIYTALSFTQLEGWAVRRNAPELLAVINRFLADQTANGGIEELHKKYQ